MSTTLALLTCLLVADAPVDQPMPSSQLVQVGISLRLTHTDDLAKLRAAQQDPRSPSFRHWLTPGEFGTRFGQDEKSYGAVTAFLRKGGLRVTEFPNRAYVEAVGTAAQVSELLGVTFAPVAGQPASVHTVSGTPRFPDALQKLVVHVGGLDTRVRALHHIALSQGGNGFGPQDVRRFYSETSLHQQGWVGQGQTLAVLSTATSPTASPDVAAITYFMRNVSDVKTAFIQVASSNAGNDVDTDANAGSEYNLDVEMQSISVPGAESITLVAAPASQVFVAGPEFIVNNLPNLTAVSVSLGACEASEINFGGAEAVAMRNALIQGTMEGQTWFAASGDSGADDCGNGTLAADFPSVIPEMVAVGGSMLSNPQWNSHGALLGYAQEQTWNEGARGGAGGGGLSTIYAQPAYQFGLNVSDAGRSTPDIASMSGNPSVASMDSVGVLSGVYGTSIASPLSAGMFALIASRVGCRLGDIHSTLYALGNAQADGGAAVFHDIVSGNLNSGNVVGPAAGVGFDQATGWGSLDVAAMAAAWPACPPLEDGGTPAAPVAVAAYDACASVCETGETCTTLPDGPSTCTSMCTTADAGSCGPGTICSTDTLYATSNTNGSCVPGCRSDVDCVEADAPVCSTCAGACIAKGVDPGHAFIGSPCTSTSECPTGSFCEQSQLFPGGYCTQLCTAGDTGTCSCPGGSQCVLMAAQFQPTSMCVDSCTSEADCRGRSGYHCQPLAHGAACLPACQIHNFSGFNFDSCDAIFSSPLACETTNGICGGVALVAPPPPDAGTPVVDAGVPTPPPDIEIAGTSSLLGKTPTGCGCDETSLSPLLFGLVALFRRRRA